ncbi:TonB-dependent receptor [Plebeiibacterium sediminum]|uniref:TonB-dependent receptor n=1 Tax=Plebeiibacterium sediminum TaxID=2992112 RepID=A0AAE3SGI2_9BACT|nr:TonB-dependent receptor [Plebeiobacterium sediminum]MCW3787323.1 TonB-dependent receptor [Plebeiobacterium sediminum]
MKKSRFLSECFSFSLTRTFKIMRITLFLILISAFEMYATDSYSQKTILSLNVQEKSLEEALDEIEQASEFYFLYSEKLVDTKRVVSINVKEAKIEKILDDLFSDTEIKYQIIDRKILLAPEFDAEQEIQQETKSIEGTVKDVSGAPLPGVTIVVLGTTNGIITDLDGKYKLDNVKPTDVLEFSFIGMDKQDIPVENRTRIDVVMKESTIGLEEVVAVGYGVQKKSDLTGSIASVNVDELKNRSTSDVGKTMQGKVAGVQILSLSGAPGTSPTFRVRGYSNNGTSDPLYIVDGLKVDDIGYLDPNNVESVEVLKDAASAAIYGAEAGNGVVLITTRSGKAAASRFFYNGMYSNQSQTNKMKMMNASQFKEYWMQAGQPESAFQNGDTDWNDVIFENGMRQSHSIGFEGGTEQASYYASITYNSDNGMVIGDEDTNERLAAQVNASYKVNDWLKVGTTNSLERGKVVSVSSNDATASGSVIGGAYFYDPTVPEYYTNDSQAPDGLNLLGAEADGFNILRNSDGQIYGASLLQQSTLWNPRGMIENFKNETWRSNINGTMYAELTPLEGLIFTSRIGYRFGNLHISNYSDGWYWNPNQFVKNGALSAELSHNVYVQWENFANYMFSLGDHDFTAMAGMKYSNNNNTFISAETTSLANDAENYRYLDYSSVDATDNVGGNNINARSLSYFGRLGWSYQSKYMLMASFRADAFDASKLSKENRWGYFPAVSGGWVISNEEFFQNLGIEKLLSYFKLRASWGINGNVDVLRDYPYTSSLILGNGYYNFNNQLLTGAAPSNQLPNNELTWEESEQTNFGFDARFFNSHLSFSLDYYRKVTNGLLATGPAPVISGTSTVVQNIGEIENSGVEMELSYKGSIGKLKYQLSGNLATLHNEVLESPYGEGRFAGGGGFLTDATYFEKGYPIWYLRTYQVDHIDETTGQPIYKTGEELGSDDGKDYAGSAIPDFTYGATISAEFKNIDLRIFGAGQHGSELFFGVVRPDLPIMNLPEFVYKDHWTASNTQASKPSSQVYQSFPSAANYASSDHWVFNSSYFKIKEIQLGYTLPSSLTKKLRVSSLRVYTSLENFFVFTDYPGIDPESMSGTQNGDTVTIPGGPTLSLGGGMGVDRVQYPAMKQVVFGINLSF